MPLSSHASYNVSPFTNTQAEDLAILKSFPPRTLGTLLEQREVILRYAATSPGIVAVCFCMAYLVMQSLAIPGTLVLSVLAGAIYGHWRGWALVSGEERDGCGI